MGPQMRKLLGFQLCDAAGKNIQGDANDPLALASFEVLHLDVIGNVARALSRDDGRFLFMPIFEGDIEEPTVYRAGRVE